MNYNKSESLWMERYRPSTVQDLVLPPDIKQKFQTYADKKDIPNLGFWSANPGCVLPGTSIEVKAEPVYLSGNEVKKLYNLDKNGYTFIKKYTITKKIQRRIYIDVNSISKPLLILAKSNYKYKQYYKLDKNFNNKFLTFEYWLYKLDIDKAYKKVKYLRKHNIRKYFEDDFSSDFFSSFKSKDAILKCRLSFLYENVKIQESNKNINFWTWRGYSKEEAKQKIKTIQSNLSYKRYDKYSKEEIREQSARCIEYWLKKGYSKKEAKQKLHEQQITFSLDICINKYGEEKGTEIFYERQKKWQDTLNSKPKDEINRINISKGSSPIKYANKPGLVYYIRFYNDEITFWKVGITSRTIQQRFSDARKSGLNYEIIYSIPFNDIYDAYLAEQIILRNHSKRSTIKYKYFKSTEYFEEDIRL